MIAALAGSNLALRRQAVGGVESRTGSGRNSLYRQRVMPEFRLDPIFTPAADQPRAITRSRRP